ncbi:tetratricopeptide repeat protein [Streptomyces sp. NPDC093510]|uniref:ATP-binding protein n=1 Tax=Streptomyces sp. NPDC093510 TaxID=3155199 RepID=UPI0034288FAD
MDQVTALELKAALTLAVARPEAARALLDAVRARVDAETAELVRAWAAPRAGTDSGELIRSLSAALAEQAAARPGLAGELRNWLGGIPAMPLPDVANSVDGGARVQGAVVQAHGIHGGVHIHPAAPVPARTRVVPRQLPPVPAHFTNRERELAALHRTATASPGAPVLAVISGPAGVGKTTLARRWLLGLADAFPDGQLYADLRGHSGSEPARPGELLGQLLRAVGEDRVPADLGEQSALWRSATAGARIALLLDNAVSAAQVRPLLPGGSRALTAVTSRGRLSGLGMDGAAFHPLGVLATHEAVELLRRRIGADRVSREYEAALSVARACAGLPLAVCVAAARVAARPRQPLAAMAGALDGRGGKVLDALRVEGEYAVRGALDTSYRLLPPEQARGYRRLGLAPVPLLSVEVAAEACSLPGDEADHLLDELAEVNLLEDLGPDPRTGAGRYRFHDLVKAHAGQLAADHDGPADSGAAVRRVVDFYLSAATEAETLLTPSHRILPRRYARIPAQRPPFTDAPGALRWLDAERAHLMAALRTAAERGWDDTAWMLADAMFPLFLRLRPYDLWIEAHQIGLAAARRAGEKEAEGQMLTSGGAGLRNAGRHDEAVDWFGQALAVARERTAALEGGRGPVPGAEGRDALTAARRAEAQALHGLGQSHRLAGRLTEATRYFRLALPLREAIGYRRGAALTRICLGDVALADGRPHEALPHLAAARTDLLAEGDPYDAARALAFLGQAALRCAGADVSAVEAAESQLAQALAEFEETHSPHWQARVLEMLGEAAQERRDPERARSWYEQSLARYETVSAPDVRRLEERLRSMGSG